ncbi:MULTISPECIES: SDR family NAD(P)-dependent oxidoreductase [Streptomyces]|uniref:SDR family NAD(P)-dependent oxidoreductase n=1 Tax=Streptomyces koelreuteriae TaxID=2838015 RepID=A0ABX8FJ61_9ACTN|nr:MULTISPECIES: SDR family NAD(P)-dependent oxidoreductase [Streptomyces]QWB21160.1 SDR family NAD(P)-dependent oxidoreductase [Streptomyces koelreuteriae]UUA04073.1 SDR family NAD(P)-dependent oxidoreductase [Streptomyces koelreuteriae]UUA11699.1 SDR family NAD(P)-dependent oxidoreductase [Streptomyces sp. CRCS-T-1]
MSDFALSSRTVLVTGATSGIGYEAARQLAERGATVLLHGRTAEEARAAADRLIATAGIDAARLRPYAADFAHLQEVEAMAEHVVRDHPHLDVLVNNAGMAAPERHTVTADGNEIAFQVNFLAHYLLTCLLEPALTRDPGGRVVNVSSSLHRTASIQWSDPNRSRRYSRLTAYAQSQLALTVFAADPRVTAVSVHPGVCDTTLLPLYAHEGVKPAEGAAHVVRLCDPAVEIVNGAYYDRAERVDPSPLAAEDRTVKRLNKLADLLVGGGTV